MTKHNIACAVLAIILLANAIFVGSVDFGNKTNVTMQENYVLYTNVVYGDHKRNVLDLCLPQNKSGRLGLVLFVHGGGWISGDKDVYDADMLYWCKTQGYASASINYRYANGDSVTINDILDDITTSLTKIKQIAANHSLDIQNVMLCGHSAGAHLSLMYAYKYANTAPIKPVAVASFSGPTDLTDQNYNNLCNSEDINYMISKISGVDVLDLSTQSAKNALLAASPINFATNNSVPTLICHGTADEMVPYSNAQTLDDKLSQLGVEHNFITFYNSDHGLENNADCWEQANYLMLKYAKRYL